MKKILLSCFLALGFGASAQIYVSESFESGSPATFVVSGAFSGSTGVYNLNPTSCDGIAAIGGNNYGATTSATLNLVYTKPTAMTANGKKIDVSFTVSTIPYSATSTISGTVNVSYSTDNGTTYIPVGTPLTLAAGTVGETCTPYSVTIPETAAVTGNFKLRIQSVSTASGNDFYTFFDKVLIAQEVTALPVCTSLILPADNATNVSVRPTLTWAAVENAQTYRVKIGTTSGGDDVLSDVSPNQSYTPSSSNVLPANTLLYASITPINSLGEATGCTEKSFTTGANPLAPYCGPLTSSAPTAMTPIKSVTFAGITNDSDATATVAGSYVAHEDFTSTVFEVKNNITTVPITVKGIGIGANGFAMTVFVDWNEDGDFNDAGESYFNTAATIKRSTTITNGVITLTGNIAIPSGTALGTKRMRVKYNFSGTSVNATLTTACADLTNGQAEDYKIDYVQFLAASDVKKANLSIYPNPFHDVLKISDVNGVKSVSITDVAGRLVKTMKPAAELNVSELKSGLYMVTLNMEDGSSKTIKAIKK
ncbi:MAG: T9SS type A sorting domain-containing protein [Flavobacteriia bacterium]|nr:T9SS type A sorting domain-containing protein [Flavobacteriia bacterium]MBH2022837.1 T9SS type A sorting domain-containing protein [Flavobacteriales bacterium]